MGLENPTERNQLLLHTKSECDSVSVRINIYAYQGVKKKKKSASMLLFCPLQVETSLGDLPSFQIQATNNFLVYLNVTDITQYTQTDFAGWYLG